MTADFNVILNFNSAKPVITGAEFKAGDKGFTINMDVRELDPTGMTPKIAFYRSNGTSVESSAVTNVGNTFSYTLLGNELAVPGIVVADLKFYDGDDQRISSASFIFTAIADTLDGLGGGTESYSDELEQLSAEFQDTLDGYIDAFGNTAPINPRGDYDNTATYEPRDMVYDSNTGTSWVCKQESTGNAPTNGSAYWQKLVNSSGGGTDDYDDLENKPKINNVTLSGNKTTADLGITIPTKTKELDDVASTTPTNGQILKYNGTSQKYEPANESGSATAAEKTDITSIIATGATNTTGAQIPNGAYFYLNGVFCRAIADIATNATFTKDTNYKEVTISNSFPSYTEAKVTEVESLTSGTATSYTATEDGWYFVRAINSGTSGSCAAYMLESNGTTYIQAQTTIVSDYVRATTAPVPLKAGATIYGRAIFTGEGGIYKLS